jgi:membrane-associated protein
VPIAVNLLSAQSLLSAFGALGVFAALFCETGILLGIVLPGDSLLFVAGFAAAGGIADVHLALAGIYPAAMIGAIAGAQVGHLLGERAGAPLFDRADSRLFKRSYVDRVERMLERFGVPRAIVLARFIPIVRTLLNPFLGIAGVPARQFAVWNVVGGLLWPGVVVTAGYYLGQVHVIRTHVEVFVLGIVVLSLVPVAVELLRERRRSSGGQPTEPPTPADAREQ